MVSSSVSCCGGVCLTWTAGSCTHMFPKRFTVGKDRRTPDTVKFAPVIIHWCFGLSGKHENIRLELARDRVRSFMIVFFCGAKAWMHDNACKVALITFHQRRQHFIWNCHTVHIVLTAIYFSLEELIINMVLNRPTGIRRPLHANINAHGKKCKLPSNANSTMHVMSINC